MLSLPNIRVNAGILMKYLSDTHQLSLARFLPVSPSFSLSLSLSLSYILSLCLIMFLSLLVHLNVCGGGHAACLSRLLSLASVLCAFA